MIIIEKKLCRSKMMGVVVANDPSLATKSASKKKLKSKELGTEGKKEKTG